MVIKNYLEVYADIGNLATMKYCLIRFSGRIASILIALGILVSLSNCNDSESPAPPEFDILEKAVLMGVYTSASLKSFLPLTGIDLSPDLLQYDVDVYIITYKTTYKGAEIIASGLAGIPRVSTALSMLSLHHGTITDNLDAPSSSNYFGQQAVFCAAFASLGLITVMPDFIGFGESRSILHPYYVEELSASAVIDNLRAVNELAGVKMVSVNKNLFLAGYSEGGYVTMATHKYLDQNPQPDFNLLASFPAAGGYDIKEMQEYVFGLDTFDDPYYLAFLTYAYKTTYDWDQPLSDFFDQPYANRIPGLFNGTMDGNEINAELTTSVSELLTTEILTSIDSNPKFANFVSALEGNSLTDWTPVKKMFMYHGEADVTVPYENSVSVHAQLLTNGASPTDVVLIPLPGATHATGLQPYIANFVTRMLELN